MKKLASNLTDQQKAAGRLLKVLASAKSVKTKDDKKQLISLITKKYTRTL